MVCLGEKLQGEKPGAKGSSGVGSTAPAQETTRGGPRSPGLEIGCRTMGEGGGEMVSSGTSVPDTISLVEPVEVG